ncbi:MAG: hypothetical protein Q8P18_17680 [Pseudomonadota bacterium]|nr:hypothetical protein [Pseudomonadota bacterium]
MPLALIRTFLGASALLAALPGCGGLTPTEAFREALAGDIPLEDALTLCDQAGESAEECVATVVRGHADAPTARCAALQSERWRSECAFGIAEARATAGDRWGALTGCGAAGAYYNECLYHAWTFELQLSADGLGRAVAGIEKARPIIAYWSGIETIGPGAEDHLWADWWYFAHARNRPASLEACAVLPDETDRRRCEEGTRTYVRRSVVEALLRANTPASTKDRICRGTPQDVLALLGDLYLPDPSLDAEVVAAVASGCAPGRVDRPWNPVFGARGAGG